MIEKIKNNKMTFISLIAILFIPILYAGNFISAFKDPYNSLEKIAVAIVNEDDYDGEEKNISSELVDTFKEDADFEYNFVTREEAIEGMEDSEYYFTVIIPEDFTSNIYSTLNNDYKEASLVYMKNDNSNYIMGILGNGFINQVESSLNKTIMESFISTLGNELSNIDEINDGVNELTIKYNTFNYSLNTLEDGTEELVINSNTLLENYNNLELGINELKEKYMIFNSGVATLNSTLEYVSNSNNSLNEGMQDYKSSLEMAINTNTNLTEEQKLELILTYETLLTNSTTINSGLSELSSSASLLNSSSEEVLAGVENIYLSTTTLNSYYNDLNTGINDVNSGVNKLNSSGKLVLTGLNDLKTGFNSYQTAITDLNLEDNANSISNVVTKTDDHYSDIETYGYGLMPYFTSISLFVGGLMVTVVLASRKKRKKREKEVVKKSFNKVLMFNGIVAVQAIVLVLLLSAAVLNINNLFAYTMFAILVAVTFMSMILMLAVLFGDIGRFLAIIVLVLQLAACGGTFPVETAPSIYQSLHAFMPMTYAVEGFRVIIGNGNNAILVNSSLILFAIVIATNAITIIFNIKNKKYI